MLSCVLGWLLLVPRVYHDLDVQIIWFKTYGFQNHLGFSFQNQLIAMFKSLKIQDTGQDD